MLALAAATLLLTAAPAAAPARPRVAVVDLKPVQGVQPGTAAVLTSIVVNDASRAGFDVISQADVATLLGVEKQKQMLGCSEDASCLAEIGGALGAEYVLSGQVGQIGSRYHVALQLLDAKKARVAARSAQFCEQSEDALAAAAQAALAELLGAVALPLAPRASAAPGPDPVAKSAPPSARWRPGKLLAWSTVGAGVAIAAGGGVSLSLAQSRLAELEDAWRRTDYAAFYDDKSAEAKRFQAIGWGAIGAGAAVTALGGWFLYRSRDPGVALLPTLAPGHAGLVAVGSF